MNADISQRAIDSSVQYLTDETPLSFTVSTGTIQAMFATHTSPFEFNQYLLSCLRNSGCKAVEGMGILRLASGRLCKLKDSVLEEQPGFTYIWLPDAYVHAIATANKVIL